MSELLNCKIEFEVVGRYVTEVSPDCNIDEALEMATRFMKEDIKNLSDMKQVTPFQAAGLSPDDNPMYGTIVEGLCTVSFEDYTTNPITYAENVINNMDFGKLGSIGFSLINADIRRANEKERSYAIDEEHTFFDDELKMANLPVLSKEHFLVAFPDITETEYDNTIKELYYRAFAETLCFANVVLEKNPSIDGGYSLWNEEVNDYRKRAGYVDMPCTFNTPEEIFVNISSAIEEKFIDDLAEEAKEYGVEFDNDLYPTSSEEWVAFANKVIRDLENAQIAVDDPKIDFISEHAFSFRVMRLDAGEIKSLDMGRAYETFEDFRAEQVQEELNRNKKIGAER